MSTPKPTLRFRFHEPTIDTNLPFTDGTITVEGFELEMVADAPDAWDQGFGALMNLQDDTRDFVCIPAFPNRKFRQSYIQVSASADISSPKDLEGRRVGISSWTNTAGIWARGALQNYYDVDLTNVIWCSRSIGKSGLPNGVNLERLPASTMSTDAQFDEMLLAGELDAVITPNVLDSVARRDPRAKRLFADNKSEEQQYFKDTGVFPISHVVALDRTFVERYPNAPAALLAAYRRARDVAFERVEGSDPAVLVVSWMKELMAEQRTLMGERYWAYNILDNTVVLDAMMHFSHQQGITATKRDYLPLFDEEAATLEGW